MGNGAAKNFYFTYSYQRDHLYKDLTEHFINDPKNHDIIRNLARLKEVLTVRPDLSIVAVQESANDYKPTCMQSAQIEYRRLLGLYSEHMRLRSVLCRVGAVACPIGHFCEKVDHVNCDVCTHSLDSGYLCTFCRYSMCEACSVIYCLEGHAMALWTHAESVHSCSVCKVDPITSGYRCHICYSNICDACTDKAGRIIVQRKIREDISQFLTYFSSYVVESEVAAQTIEQHEKDLILHPFPTVLDLMTKRVLYARLKQVVQAQVYLYKITQEINRLRAIITLDIAYSAPCRRESVRQGYMVVEEIRRLTTFIRVRAESKLPEMRAKHIIACPLGHGMASYIGCPRTYLDKQKQSQKSKMRSIKEEDEDDENSDNEKSAATERESDEDERSENSDTQTDTTDDSTIDSNSIDYNDGSSPVASTATPDRYSLLNPPRCRVCNRKSNRGYHCALCEYDLCETCSEIFCTNGHRMAIWNAPDAKVELPESTANKFMHSEASFDPNDINPPKPSAILSVISEEGDEDGSESASGTGSKNRGIAFDLSSIAESSTILSNPPIVITSYTCSLCHEPNINSGYSCCGNCQHETAYLCDKCTAPEGRKRLRQRWDDELDDIMRFMRTERLMSDICRRFQWQLKAAIVGVGMLLEHLREMQEWQRKAKLQIKYKKIIDEIKDLRKFVAAYPDICAISRRELAWTPDYVFETKKDARRELTRHRALMQISDELRSYECRLEGRFACPLGHGTQIIQSHFHLSQLYQQAALLRLRAIPPDQLIPSSQQRTTTPFEEPHAGDYDHQLTIGDPQGEGNNYSIANQDNAIGMNSMDWIQPFEDGRERTMSDIDYITSGMNSSNKKDYILAHTPDYELPPLSSMDLGCYDSYGETINISLCCAICNSQDLIEGRFCLYCEYIVCSTCSVIYCRQGHPTKIWTLPDAVKLKCYVCAKDPICSGYRCLECEVDICDECTTKKSRAGMQLWPMREGVKIMQYFESVRNQSDIARSYYKRYGKGALKDWIDEDKLKAEAEAAEAAARAKRAAEVAANSAKISKKDKVRTSNASEMGGFSYKSAAVRQAIEDNLAAADAEAKAKAAADVLPKILGPIGKAYAPVALPLQPGGSMAHTCRVLLELRAAKQLVDEEIGLKSLRTIQSGRPATVKRPVAKAWTGDL